MFIDVKAHIGEPAVREIASAAVFDHSEDGLDRWEARMREGDSRELYAWMVDDEMLGVCGFEVHSDRLEIVTIAVTEPARGQGIGRAMVSALREKYGLPLEAETDDDAVDFYRRCGFVTMEIRKHGVRRYACVL